MNKQIKIINNYKPNSHTNYKIKIYLFRKIKPKAIDKKDFTIKIIMIQINYQMNLVFRIKKSKFI